MAKTNLKAADKKGVKRLTRDKAGEPPRDVTIGGTMTAASFAGAIAATSAANSGTLIETSTVSPSALAAGETVLLTPTSDTREIVVTSSGVAFLCSLLAGTTGQRKWLRNTGAYSIALGHDEGASYGGAAAANCFACPDAIPYVLRPGAAVEVMYTGSRWRVLGVNVFAPGGRLCPATIAEFLERTAFTPTYLWPADETGADGLALLREAGNSNLAVVNTPLVDRRLGGYRGHSVTEGGNGWRADIASPALLSTLVQAFFGHGALGGSDNLIFGRVDTTAAARRAYIGTKSADGKFAGYIVGADGNLYVPTCEKVVTDSVVRLGSLWINRDTDLGSSRISGRGEVAVASPDVDIALTTTISGGATPFDFVAATALTGCVAPTQFCGGWRIDGAQAERVRAPAKIAHRLGME